MGRKDISTPTKSIPKVLPHGASIGLLQNQIEMELTNTSANPGLISVL